MFITHSSSWTGKKLVFCAGFWRSSHTDHVVNEQWLYEKLYTSEIQSEHSKVCACDEITVSDNVVHQPHDNSRCTLHTGCDTASHCVKMLCENSGSAIRMCCHFCLTFQWIKAVLLFCLTTLWWGSLFMNCEGYFITVYLQWVEWMGKHWSNQWVKYLLCCKNPVGSHYKQEMYWKGIVQVNDMGNFQYWITLTSLVVGEGGTHQ